MNKKLLILSLPYLMSVMAPVQSFAAVRVANQSRSQYADAYNQAVALQQQAQYYNQQQETAVENLPIDVANQDLAETIARGGSTENVNRTTLESCAAIYPGGKFAWDRPYAGIKAGSSATCVAVVEMRVINGTDDIVVARTHVAAGDSIECNIDKFPSTSLLPDAYNVTFPADKEPTMDDVIKVMNNEQKKNAGTKIAAGVVLGGLAGNAAGKPEVGQSGVFGGGKGKTQGTLIGALSGGALMAGSSYAGKVGGDIILSTGINAAAGGVIGNMVASGSAVLHIENCKDLNGSSTKCLWGVLQKHKSLEDNETAFYNISDGRTAVCKTDATHTIFTNCREENVVAMTFKEYANIEAGFRDQNFLKVRTNTDSQYTYNSEKDKQTMTQGFSGSIEGIWTKVESAGRPTQRVAAMVPNFRGKPTSEWYKWRGANPSAEVVGRDTKGEAIKLPENETWSINDFYPLMINAEDGSIIDINNRARAKSTAIGATAGAGLGALTAYQGASDEVENRWVGAVTEYKDSLQKVYCATGTRFLSQYNDLAVIPNMR